MYVTCKTKCLLVLGNPHYLFCTVVKATVLLDDINNFGAVNEVYAKCKYGSYDKTINNKCTLWASFGRSFCICLCIGVLFP